MHQAKEDKILKLYSKILYIIAEFLNNIPTALRRMATIMDAFICLNQVSCAYFVFNIFYYHWNHEALLFFPDIPAIFK
jgi:hypothetical protein